MKVQCKHAHKFLELVSHIEMEYEQNARLSLRISAYVKKKSLKLLNTSPSKIIVIEPEKSHHKKL